MDKNTYTLVNKFECFGKMMITVIIKGRAVCVMSEFDYRKIIEAERRYLTRNKLRKLLS